jgi:hypothetical protein
MLCAAYVFYLFISFQFLNLNFWFCLKKILWNGWGYSFISVKSNLEITEQMSSVEDDDDVDSEIQMFQNALEFSGWRQREMCRPEPSSYRH